MSSYFNNILLLKNYKDKLKLQKISKNTSYKIAVCRMLVKLTPVSRPSDSVTPSVAEVPKSIFGFDIFWININV
jgi:hypothetical protein